MTRERRLRPQIAGEYDGVDSLLTAVESGLGVAVVTMRAANRLPERVRLKELAGAPEPLCIAVGLRAGQADNKPLAVFVEELSRAFQVL